MASPIQRLNPSRSVTRTAEINPLQGPVSVDVQSEEVEAMLRATMTVLAGPNLERYLEREAYPHIRDEIVQRFAYEGDRKSGHWPALSDATQNIRRQEGFGPDWPINVRTEEMFQTVTQEADFTVTGPNSAEAMIPGRNVDSETAQKIATAQLGSRGTNPMSPNFRPTPPRPVLAVDETDLQELLVRLNNWIMVELVGGLGGTFV